MTGTRRSSPVVRPRSSRHPAGRLRSRPARPRRCGRDVHRLVRRHCDRGARVLEDRRVGLRRADLTGDRENIERVGNPTTASLCRWCGPSLFVITPIRNTRSRRAARHDRTSSNSTKERLSASKRAVSSSAARWLSASRPSSRRKWRCARSALRRTRSRRGSTAGNALEISCQRSYSLAAPIASSRATRAVAA